MISISVKFQVDGLLGTEAVNIMAHLQVRVTVHH